MTTAMATDLLANRRATLWTSRNRWSRTDRSEIEKCNEDIVQDWLTSISKTETKPEVVLETTVKTVKENDSKYDDLALGVEASLYGKRSLRTVRDFLRLSQDPPALCRWNSFASALSTQSEVSVMDVLNMLQDDPEELLLDLGFGIDEPDITGRIPARFLSYQSNARGISFQLFLDAQQSRIDIENPDVRNRFRQLEVLQQVTTTFSNLVGGSDTYSSQMYTEARERRKRVASILRRAAKKSLRQARTSQGPNPPAPSAQSVPETLDKRIPPKRTKVSDSSGLSGLVEERSVTSEPVVSSSTLRVTTDPLKHDSVPSSMGKGMRELEEIQSVDEGRVPGSCSGPVDPGGGRLDFNVISSGFLEDPSIPALSHHNNPGSDLKKMLNGISQEDPKSWQRSTEHTESPAAEPHGTTRNHIHTDSSASRSRNSVLRTTDNKSIQNPVDSTQTAQTLTGNENSDSSSADISQMNSNGVYTLAYFVQMDPVSLPTEIRDRFQSPDRGASNMSIYEELRSAEIISRSFPTDPGALNSNVAIHEITEQIWESQDQNVTPDNATGCNSPTALKRRRESFSRRSWSDVVIDSDSGMGQTPSTHSPFTSLETSTPQLWNSMERCRDLGCMRMRSMSLDTGLSCEEEDHRWECALWAGTQRCFHCGAPINYNNSWAKIHPELVSDPPYSLGELENMMKCMRKFRSVLTEIEMRLEEEQVTVIGSLSESHREEVEDVLRLREAVKQEAGVLEQQLSDLVHHYDDSIKMKLTRLLDEQSKLCSQLHIIPAPESSSTRSVAIQCCLLPLTSSIQRCCHHHHHHHHHQCTCHTHPHRTPYQTQWDSNNKPDALDFVAFIKSLKNSLRLSLKNTSLE